MKKAILVLFAAAFMVTNFSNCAFADCKSAHITKGQVTSKTIIGGTLSLLIWPGIGQAMNDNKGEKVLSHAVIGLLPPFRFWSCYDAVVDRKGGYWEGRI